MSIPSVITAGDSLSFVESYSSYPAGDGWSLQIILMNQAGKIELGSSASGNDFAFEIAAAETASWTAGSYRAIPVFSNSAERITLDSSPVTVEPDPLTVNALDGRTQAQRILDSLRACYESFVKTGMVQEVGINGRVTKFRTAEDILDQINYWQTVVNAEYAKKSGNASGGFGKRILTKL